MNRIWLAILFLLAINLCLYSQDNKSAEVTWYDIIYDNQGTISELVEAAEAKYNTPMVMKVLFNGFKENTSVKITITDDEGNVSFKHVAKIENNEVQFELKLLTSKNYLINAIKPYVRFRYKIDSRNQYHFESEYFDVGFMYMTHAMLLPVRPAIPTDNRFVLRSADGEYEHAVYVDEDGVFSERAGITVFTFPNVIPGKNYSMYFSRDGQEYPRVDTFPFHKLLNTIEREANSRKGKSFSPLVQIIIFLACLLLLLILFVSIVDIYMKKKRRNITIV